MENPQCWSGKERDRPGAQAVSVCEPLSSTILFGLCAPVTKTVAIVSSFTNKGT